MNIDPVRFTRKSEQPEADERKKKTVHMCPNNYYYYLHVHFTYLILFGIFRRNSVSAKKKKQIGWSV